MSGRQWITDSAVVRWLTKVAGIDFDDVRAEIAATPGLAEAINLGSTRYSANGLTFLIKDGLVTGILDGETPSAPRRSKFTGHLGSRQNNKTKASALDRRDRLAQLALQDEDENEDQ